MHRKTVIAGALALMSSISMANESCGKVTIADMNWNSATLMAHVDKFILENGYGCDVELVVGDTIPTGTSMVEKGEPDIAPEIWSNSMKEAIEKGVKEKRLRLAGRSLSDGGEEGFWVPKYMVEQDPSLATIEGILKHPELFPHPEDDSLGAVYNCPAGWTCQIVSQHQYDALGMEAAKFDLIDPGSAAGLSGSIARAYDRGKGWLGYYWAPTAILGRYEMVKVDFGTGVDEEHYRECLSKEDCLNPHASMWPVSPVHTLTTENFANKEKGAYQYLSKRAFTNQDMNVLLAWMEYNQADGELGAEHFFEHYEAL